MTFYFVGNVFDESLRKAVGDMPVSFLNCAER